MPIDKFRFVSPGVQVAEIDQSRRARDPEDPGPVIIGRFQRGPTMRPTKVDSLAELTEVFGDAITGRESSDISRNGNYSAPSYAAFAANAWLANNGGATIVRLVGKEHDDSAAAGAAGWTVSPTTDLGRGGAWGLWVIPSGSDKEMTGTLGAILYCDDDTGVVLSGTLAADTSETGQGSTSMFKFTDGNIRMKVIRDLSDANLSNHGSSVAEEDVSINFTPSSRNFVRKVLNTTPHNTNTGVVEASADDYRHYWLGETFEDKVSELIASAGAGNNLLAFTAPLASGSDYYYDHTYEAQPAKTGWTISQDVSADSSSYSPASMTKLFRFVTLEEAEWSQRNLKISIRNIRLPNSSSNANKYGSFDVQIRKITDTDAVPEPLESFAGVNLNPASPNYIGARIGDQYAVWSDTEKRYRYFGSYPNASKYIRVEVASSVEEGSITEELVPFGFYGTPRPKTNTLLGGGSSEDLKSSYILGNLGNAAAALDGGNLSARAGEIYLKAGTAMETGANRITASIEWPAHKLVGSASAGFLADPTDRYFGVNLMRHQAGSTVFDESVYDLAKSRNVTNKGWDTAGNMEYAWIFSLDDVSQSVDGYASSGFVYKSGSRADNKSWTTIGGGSGSPESIIEAGYDKFTMPLYGGFDGLEIKEMEPLINNTIINNKNILNSYEFYTLRRAIDTVADAELVDMNILTMPGITNSGITNHILNTCERRADALGIIDVENAYIPRHESSDASDSSRNGAGTDQNPTKCFEEMKRRALNNSYGCAYYPWVQVSAPVSGLPTWCPPSVVALGAMSYGQATQALWFAPAGFTRGGLTEGRGGLPVMSVSQRLSAKERDKLYEVNVNPIAHFPAEGIVIFGQKTLQATPSALDRVNVRRLMIFMKKRISSIAATLLFEPNISATWGRFTSKVQPFLEGIKAGFGLDDFKVVLDKTTTTADLIDRNTMYAKIYVKPTKAIEFIAIDFVITSAGASFDD